MNRLLLRLTTILGLLCLLAACSKSSRFDDKAVVDACAIVGDEEAESILGTLIEPPKADPPGGFAGVCRYSFESASGDRNGELTVMLVTYASNAKAGSASLGRWFEENVTFFRASIDAHPKELKRVGDRALLFGGKPGISAIMMRQSQTFAILRFVGEDPARLESFAEALAREAAAKETAPALKRTAKASTPMLAANPAGPAAAASTAPTSPLAAARRDRDEKAKTLLLYTIGYVEECTRADRLLRKSCDRWRGQMPASMAQHCELPEETFEARTAESYRAFRESWREQIEANETALSKLAADGQADFDRQFEKAIAGTVSGFDLESLNRLLKRECTTIETEWLPNLRRGNDAGQNPGVQASN